MPLHRWFALANNNTEQPFVTTDPGFSFDGTLYRRSAVTTVDAPCSLTSLEGTYVGTTSGTVPASPMGGDPNASLPIMMGFVYTFDGKGRLVAGYGSTNGGPPDPTTPLGMPKATGTYSVDPATCTGVEEIIVQVAIFRLCIAGSPSPATTRNNTS